MARKIRMEYAGAVYHVMARGNQGQDFRRRSGSEALAGYAGAGMRASGVAHPCVCVDAQSLSFAGGNAEGNLVAGMKWLQSTYTQRYNSRHRVFGHLFQGRYKALVVDGAEGNYFAIVSTYIHLNPARAAFAGEGGSGRLPVEQLSRVFEGADGSGLVAGHRAGDGQSGIRAEDRAGY